MPQKKSNIRLLIIDDELGFYQSFLAKHQATHAFETVKEIKRGVGLIGSFKPEAIFLTYSLGKSNHEQGVNSISFQSIHQSQGIYPVIVVTSAKEKHIYQRALENGAWACLQKIDCGGTFWHQKILNTIANLRDHLNINHS